MACCVNNQVAPFDEDRCDALFLGLEDAGKSLLVRKLQGLHDKARRESFKTSTYPTTGVEICYVGCGSKAACPRLRVRELGGSMGPIWPNYFEDCDALVYVMDATLLSPPHASSSSGVQPEDSYKPPQPTVDASADQGSPSAQGSDAAQPPGPRLPPFPRPAVDKMDLAVQQLHAILSHPHMQGKPCCVVVNKCDLVGRKSDGSAEGTSLVLVQAEQALGWAQLLQSHQGLCSLQMASAVTGKGAHQLLAWLTNSKTTRRATEREVQVAPPPQPLCNT